MAIFKLKVGDTWPVLQVLLEEMTDGAWAPVTYSLVGKTGEFVFRPQSVTGRARSTPVDELRFDATLNDVDKVASLVWADGDSDAFAVKPGYWLYELYITDGAAFDRRYPTEGWNEAYIEPNLD